MTRDISSELKALRLNGMAEAWAELTTQEGQAHDEGAQDTTGNLQ